jgi:hypothetical protein
LDLRFFIAPESDRLRQVNAAENGAIPYKHLIGFKKIKNLDN